MKIKDLNYYVKFIFSSESDSVCFSTTDRQMLNHVKFHKTGNTPMDYKIGDIIHFEPDKKPYEITNIHVRQLTEDTEVFKYGFDSDDCTSQQGEQKEFLFSILISIKPSK